MKSYKKINIKKSNNKNKTKKIKYKGGMPKMPGKIPAGMPSLSDAMTLVPIITRLMPLINKGSTMFPPLIAKYSNPANIIALTTKLFNDLKNNSIIINEFKTGNNPKIIYQQFISILKNFENDLISLYEDLINIFCGQKNLIQKLLNSPQIKPMLSEVQSNLNKIIETCKSQAIPKITEEIKKITELLPYESNIITLINKLIGVLESGPIGIITAVCDIISDGSSGTDVAAAAGVSAAAAATAAASYNSHDKLLEKPKKKPIEQKGTKRLINLEKIKGAFKTNVETINNDNNLINATLNLSAKTNNNNIDIDSIILDMKYPSSIDVTPKKSTESIHFILDPFSVPLSYVISSSLKAEHIGKEIDINSLKFPVILEGTIHDNKDKEKEKEKEKDKVIKLTDFNFDFNTNTYVIKDNSEWFDNNNNKYEQPPIKRRNNTNILIVDVKKITNSVHSKDDSINIKKNEDGSLNIQFKKENNIDINNINYELNYPPSITVDSGVNNKTLSFILDSSGKKLFYKLASNQDIGNDEMLKINLKPTLEGIIETTVNKNTSKNKVHLANFKLSNAKASSFSFYRSDKDVKKPIYVLQE
jgi:hypothetical protein